GADDVTGRTSGRIPYPGADDVTGRTSGRIPYPSAGDVTDRPSGRVPRAGDGVLDERSGARARSGGDAFLGDTPSGRLPRRDGGALDDRPSSRTLRTGDGDLTGGRVPYPGADDVTGRSSGRVPHPGAGDVTDRPSGRVPYPGADDVTGRTGGRGGDDTGGRIPRPASGEQAPARAAGAGHLPRLVVLVDDFDALVAPALGAPGRPAAGSVVRALEAVARNGERLGVHLVATSSRPDRTADTELAHGARLRIVLDAPPVAAGPDVPAAGRGRLGHPDGRVTPFQAGRVTGRIPRTATLRPTVVPLEWERMGDPPTRRPVRELGNGPTDLALLASALDRAARSVEATPVPPLTPAARG
ncbi:FHA domain-containing protein, partial [Streptomyces tanashiensis]